MKSKIFLGVLLVLFNLQSCKKQYSPNKESNEITTTEYIISGHYYESDQNQKVILYKFNPVTQLKTPIDTAYVSKNGTYKLKYDFEESDLFRVDFPNRKYVMLAVDEGQDTITLNVKGNSIDMVFISGSIDSEKLLAYEQFRKVSYNKHVDPTYEAMKKAGKTNENPIEEIKAVDAYAKANAIHRKELIDFAEVNIGTSIALFGTMLRWTGEGELLRLDKLISNFEKVHPQLSMTKIMRDKVERYKKVALNSLAPEIAEKNKEGVLVKLSEVKGKVTLIDFWASWCGPCLRQIPDLKEAYNLYHDKGFEIFGVSVDTKKKSWKSSIDKYEMTWLNVSDLKGWGSEAAASYNVTFVPFNFLLNEKGVIIAKNLHSKELQEKLSELLN